MNHLFENDYKNLVFDILVNGTEEEVRDNNKALTLFGKRLEFQCLLNVFPLLTSKEMFFKNIKFELKWILDGLTNVNYLKSNGVSIWDKWADETGDIGDTYGRQLRGFNGVDQLRTIMYELGMFKRSRQLVISLWNPVAISNGNRRPCYPMFQFQYCSGKLNISVTQRSADVFVGLPYDIAFFTLFLKLVCNYVNLTPGKVLINITDAHIYVEHIEACKKYLSNQTFDLPNIYLEPSQHVFNFEPKLVHLRNYKHCEFIKAKIII